MEIVFRADASNDIGSGHVMRCLVLAEAFIECGHNVTFVCRDLPGNLIEFISPKNIKLVVLNKPSHYREIRDSADYLGWLQVSWEEDVQEFLKNIKSANLVITDHYAIDNKWETKVKRTLNCNILVVDDLNRKHESEFIVDQNLWPDIDTRYQHSPGVKLLGPNYAILRPSFSLLSKKEVKPQNQVIAFFGGSDLTNECIKLIKAAKLIKTLPFTLKVVTGRANDAYQELLMLSEGTPVIVELFIKDFDLELKKTKYVIGASGVSNWERFCLQIPATIVSVAENQRALSQHLSNLGVVRYLGDSSLTSIDSYLTELIYLCSNWPNVDQLQKIAVDGLGVNRIIRVIEKELEND